VRGRSVPKEPLSAAKRAMRPARVGAPTQQRLTDAALTLFATKGYAATGIREIAEAADLTSAALYHYMGTKEDLLIHLMTEGLQRFVSASRQALVDLPGAERELVALTRVHVATETVMRRLSLVIDGEVRSLTDGAGVLALRDEYESLWAGTISLGLSAGAFNVAEPRLARLALVEMCNGVAQWFSPQGQLSLSQVCDHFSDMALALLGARDPLAGTPVTCASLQMRPASHEIGLVRASYASFGAPDLPE
jgi:AcrR family transcriptional regulator